MSGKSILSGLVLGALIFSNTVFSVPFVLLEDEVTMFKISHDSENRDPGNQEDNIRKPVVRTSTALEERFSKRKLPLILGGLVVGGVVAVYLLVKKSREAAEPKTGTLEVHSIPTGAGVYLNGLDTGKTTNCVLTDLLPQRHSVRLVKEGYVEAEQSVIIVSGQTASVNIHLVRHTISVTHPDADAVWVPGREVEIHWTTGESAVQRITGAGETAPAVLGVSGGVPDARRAADLGRTLAFEEKAAARMEGAGAKALVERTVPYRDLRAGGKSQTAGEREESFLPRGVVRERIASQAAAVGFSGRIGSGSPDFQGESRPLVLTNIGIKLFRGENEIRTVVSDTNNTGFFKWTVPGELEEADDYKIRVHSADSPEVYGDGPKFRMAKTGSIRVLSDPPDARIFLNGADTGYVTDSTLTGIEPGAYEVRLVKEGHFDAEESVSVEAGRTAAVNRVLRPTRETVRDIEMVYIPPGEFMMGSPDQYPDERPVHRVRITKGFWIGKFEVTQGQWRSVMGNNPSGFQLGDDYPVERVSWNEIQTFIQRLNQMTGRTFRLPTEAEWEYACRAGTTGEFYGNLDDIAWYHDNSGASSHPVGGKTPNAFGLYDMLGNVWEFVQDWYEEDYYSRSPVLDPPGPSTGTHRIVRSGSWANGPHSNRSARRKFYLPNVAYTFIGFRLAMTD